MGPHARASPDPPPVIAREDAESFELEPTEEEELLRASAEAERGNLVDGGEVLATSAAPDRAAHAAGRCIAAPRPATSFATLGRASARSYHARRRGWGSASGAPRLAANVTVRK